MRNASAFIGALLFVNISLPLAFSQQYISCSVKVDTNCTTFNDLLDPCDQKDCHIEMDVSGFYWKCKTLEGETHVSVGVENALIHGHVAAAPGQAGYDSYTTTDVDCVFRQDCGTTCDLALKCNSVVGPKTYYIKGHLITPVHPCTGSQPPIDP